MVLMAEKLQKT